MFYLLHAFACSLQRNVVTDTELDTSHYEWRVVKSDTMCAAFSDLNFRWQDRCLEVRMAAQALLTRELTRLTISGRKRLVESWSAFLPTLLDPTLSIFGSRALVAAMNTSLGSAPQPPPIPQRKGERTLPDPTVNGLISFTFLSSKMQD